MADGFFQNSEFFQTIPSMLSDPDTLGIKCTVIRILKVYLFIIKSSYLFVSL
jgi:hypothetical protein